MPTPVLGPESPVEICQVESEFEQALVLYRAAAPTRVLEVGTAAGGTLYHWLEHAAKDATVVTVDLPDPAYELDRERCKTWPRDDVSLVMVAGDSHTPDTVAQVAEHAPYGWIFIDGDHRYEHAAADVANFWPMLADDGYLLLHDICLEREYDDGSDAGVGKLWGELRGAGYWTRELRVAPSVPLYGIGIVKGKGVTEC